MPMIEIKHRGSFKKSERFFKRALKRDYRSVLEDFGQIGVQLLHDHTPVDSGKTADSWDYHVVQGDGQITVYWTNSNENDGVNVAILLIYGHGLANGTYVEGNDFVTPAMRPLFEELSKRLWREVTK